MSRQVRMKSTDNSSPASRRVAVMSSTCAPGSKSGTPLSILQINVLLPHLPPSRHTYRYMTVGLVHLDSDVWRILVFLQTVGVCVTDSGANRNQGYHWCTAEEPVTPKPIRRHPNGPLASDWLAEVSVIQCNLGNRDWQLTPILEAVFSCNSERHLWVLCVRHAVPRKRVRMSCCV